MLVHPTSKHHQIGYVTHDLEAAMALCKEMYGIDRFFVLPMVDTPDFFILPTRDGPAGAPKIRVALANAGGLEIELIQPVANVPIFADPLQGEDVPPIVFHHTCNHIAGSLADWEAYRAGLDEAVRPVVFEGGSGNDLRFVYTDERLWIGHYLEHVWMSPAMKDQVRAAIPSFPEA